MGDRGSSITEVSIIVAVIGVLVSVLGYSYKGWIDRYKVESVTKELYFDLLNARARAFSKSRKHITVLSDYSYEIAEDTNDNGVKDTGDRTLPSFPKTTGYKIAKNGSGNKIYFNIDGQITPSRTIHIVSESDPDRDCITISAWRIIMGKYVSGDCQPM